MGDRRCCCIKCFLDSDDFNRADSTDLGSKWVQLTPGEWEIVGNYLHCITAGPCITTHRQAAGTRPGAERSIRFSVKLKTFPATGTKQWAIICRYISSTKWDWIGLTYNASTYQLQPAFYSHDGGVDTLLMDITTHPAGEFWTVYPETDTFHVEICYAESEWTITPTGVDIGQGEVYWARVGAVGQLPALYGMVGFWYGDFDDWYYERHWEDLLECLYCHCFCRHPNDVDDYNGVPETLTATIIADSAYACSEIDGLTLTLHQSFPGATVYDPAPVKKWWFSDPFYVQSAQAWLVLKCADGQFWMACLLYENTNFLGGQMTYLRFGESVSAPEIASWDLANSTCDPLSLRFNGLWTGPTTCTVPLPTPHTGEKPYPCVSGICVESGTMGPISWHVIVTE